MSLLSISILKTVFEESCASADSDDPDQTAHLRSLIRATAVRICLRDVISHGTVHMLYAHGHAILVCAVLTCVVTFFAGPSHFSGHWFMRSVR